MDWGPVEREIDGAIEGGAFPGAVLLVGRKGQVLYHRAFGLREVDPNRTPMHPETIFDRTTPKNR
jgi:hypothetical protein